MKTKRGHPDAILLGICRQLRDAIESKDLDRLVDIWFYCSLDLVDYDENEFSAIALCYFERLIKKAEFIITNTL
jgi:hypothetical protein